MGEMKSVKDRVAWVDAARGIAIILVVLHHSIQGTLDADIASDHWSAVTEFVRTMRMPLFFACAGIFAGKWIHTKTWGEMLRAKVLLLMWVYLLWLVIRSVWDSLVLGEGAEPWASFGWRMLGGNEGWFIYTLALMFIVAKAVRRVPFPVQLVVAGIAAAVVMRFDIPARAYEGLAAYLLYFLIGVYGRAFLMRAADRMTFLRAAAVVAVWIIAYGVLFYFDGVTWPVVDIALRLLGLAAGVAIATQVQGLRVLTHFGQSTLPIYITHQMWIGGLVLLAMMILPAAGWVPFVIPLLVAVPAFAVAYGAGKLAPKIHAEWLFETPRWLERAVTPRRVTV